MSTTTIKPTPQAALTRDVGRGLVHSARLICGECPTDHNGTPCRDCTRNTRNLTVVFLEFVARQHGDLTLRDLMAEMRQSAMDA